MASYPKNVPTYVDRLLQQGEFKRKIDCLIVSLGFDVLALPDAKIPPLRFEDATNGRYEVAEFSVSNDPGKPDATPGHHGAGLFHGRRAPHGLQFIGLEYQEQQLLKLDRGLRVTIGARRAPPESL
ncbi:hypothetical protein DL765_007085 [Monosporascus sp. GIB2]|nr:hypothetical protein DL765_007085 [Monosporascus sp. GIB2]